MRGTVRRYEYWFSVLAGSVTTDQQEKERKAGTRAERIMTKRLLLDSITSSAGHALAHSVPRQRSARDKTIYCAV